MHAIRRFPLAEAAAHRAPVQRLISEAFDWNDPPMFKSFLRIDATIDDLRIRCFGLSGYREAEHSPPVEDEFTIPLN